MSGAIGLPPESDSTIRHTLPIEEVVVVGQSPEEAPVLHSLGRTRFTNEQIATSLSPSLLPLLTEGVPSLFVTSRGVMGYGLSTGAAGTISLRGIGGAPTTGLLVVIDDQPQYSGLMGHPIADSYLSHGVEAVEVVRGPASVRYGSQAMGGVIRITTRKNDREGLHGGVRLGGGSYGSATSQLHLSWQQGPLSLTLSGGYNRTDGHRANMNFAQGAARLGGRYRLNERWSLGGDLSIDRFNSSNPGPVTAPLHDNDARILRGTASLSLRHRHTTSSGSATLFYNLGLHQINDGYREGEAPLDYRFHSRDHTLGVTLQEVRHLFRGNTLALGLDLFDFGGEAWNRFLSDDHKEVIADKRQQEGALYFDMNQQLGRFTLQAGLRYDHHLRVGGEWVPQGGVTAKLPAHLTLRASVGKGFRFPTIREMYLFPSQNPDLEPEELINYEVSLSQKLFKGRLLYGITLFHIEGRNRIQTVMVDGRPHNENTGRIRNRGLEVEVTANLGRHLFVEGSYSLLKMKYPVLGAPEQKLCGRLRYNGGRWHLSLDTQYIEGLYTRLEGPSLPAVREEFFLVGAKGSCQVARWVTLWIRGENLLAQHYTTYLGFPMPEATWMAGAEFSF